MILEEANVYKVISLEIFKRFSRFIRLQLSELQLSGF